MSGGSRFVCDRTMHLTVGAVGSRAGTSCKAASAPAAAVPHSVGDDLQLAVGEPQRHARADIASTA